MPHEQRLVRKLMNQRTDKNNCFTQHRKEKLYVGTGMNVMRIFKVMKFKQEKWLKQFLHTRLTSKVENKFQQFFCESMN